MYKMEIQTRKTTPAHLTCFIDTLQFKPLKGNKGIEML